MKSLGPLFLALTASYNFEQYQRMKAQGEDVTELKAQIKDIIAALPYELISPDIRRSMKEFTND